jgi:hypothetical protein
MGVAAGKSTTSPHGHRRAPWMTPPGETLPGPLGASDSYTTEAPYLTDGYSDHRVTILGDEIPLVRRRGRSWVVWRTPLGRGTGTGTPTRRTSRTAMGGCHQGRGAEELLVVGGRATGLGRRRPVRGRGGDGPPCSPGPAQMLSGKVEYEPKCGAHMSAVEGGKGYR